MWYGRKINNWHKQVMQLIFPMTSQRKHLSVYIYIFSLELDYFDYQSVCSIKQKIHFKSKEEFMLNPWQLLIFFSIECTKVTSFLYMVEQISRDLTSLELKPAPQKGYFDLNTKLFLKKYMTKTCIDVNLYWYQYNFHSKSSI